MSYYQRDLALRPSGVLVMPVSAIVRKQAVMRSTV